MNQQQSEKWLAGLSPELRPIAEVIRTSVVEAAPGLQEVVKWGNLTFEGRGLVCYIAAYKDHANLGFFNGASLNAGKDILEGSGKKMRHIKVPSIQDAHSGTINRMVREAAALDQTAGK